VLDNGCVNIHILILVSSFHLFHHISSSFLSTPVSFVIHTTCFIQSSCHCVSPSCISCFVEFLLHLLLVYDIIITRHHVMIFTLLHHLSSVHSIAFHSHCFSHLSVRVCLILATFRVSSLYVHS